MPTILFISHWIKYLFQINAIFELKSPYFSQNDALSSIFIYNNNREKWKCIEMWIHYIIRCINHKYFLFSNIMRVVLLLQLHTGSLCIVCAYTIQMTISTCPLRSDEKKIRRKTCAFGWFMVCVYYIVINNEKFNICGI